MSVPDYSFMEALEYAGYTMSETDLKEAEQSNFLFVVYQKDHDDYQVQGWLSSVGIFNQKDSCAYCGHYLKHTAYDLHHALLSRKDVQGSKVGYLIHHTYNVLLVHRGNCHENLTRQKSLEVLSSIYGFDKINIWYESLPFQVVKERKLVL